MGGRFVKRRASQPAIQCRRRFYNAMTAGAGDVMRTRVLDIASGLGGGERWPSQNPRFCDARDCPADGSTGDVAVHGAQVGVSPRTIGVLLAIDGLAYLCYSFTDILAPDAAAHLVPWIQLPALVVKDRCVCGSW
jgi:hypothetical protein